MAGLDPAIQAAPPLKHRPTAWMRGSSPRMTAQDMNADSRRYESVFSGFGIKPSNRTPVNCLRLSDDGRRRGLFSVDRTHKIGGVLGVAVAFVPSALRIGAQ